MDCEEIKLLFPSKLTDVISSSEHQTNESVVETSVDHISENLVDLDESIRITSPTQTGKKLFSFDDLSLSVTASVALMSGNLIFKGDWGIIPHPFSI